MTAAAFGDNEGAVNCQFMDNKNLSNSPIVAAGGTEKPQMRSICDPTNNDNVDGPDDNDVVDSPTQHGMKELHIAPMMGTTTKEFRQLMRILSKRCTLWTEMIVDSTVLNTEHREFTLGYDDAVEHPVVCQLGGHKPNQIYQATKTIASYNYDEINLNCGCPSDRVSGKQEFGAVLMKNHEKAASAVNAMVQAVNRINETDNTKNNNNTSVSVDNSISAAQTRVKSTSSSPSSDDDDCQCNGYIENGDNSEKRTSRKCTTNIRRSRIGQNHPSPKISVKCRVGVDEFDTLDDLIAFIDKLSQHTNIFYLHARKAILGGLLSPHENRCIPPLNYPRVYKICQLFPHCTFYINGGIKTLKDAKDLCYGIVARQNDDNVGDDEQHKVPCTICKFDNGSCIAPPSFPAPKNLRGCMLGRVCVNNPVVLWDVDRYFYGEPTNPCQTRKDIFDKYCAYLDRHCPRRCCDRDPIVTSQFNPHPKVYHEYDYCPLCVELYHQQDENNSISKPRIAPMANFDNGQEKIKVCTISQCVKPVLHVFYGMKYGKKFSHEIEVIVRNGSLRNCGPTAVIKRALLIMPDDLLNQPFVPASDEEVEREGR